MSDFTAGFIARHNAAAEALHRAFNLAGEMFAPSDIRDRAAGGQPNTYTSQDGGMAPKHFSPADPDVNPTEGWDPFAADAAARPAGASGFVDPIKAAHDMGYAEGKAAGLAEAAANDVRDRALIEAISAELRSAGQLDRERLAAQLRQAVMLLLGRLVGEAGVDGDLLARRIDAATELLADSAESALLRVHPEDLPLLEDRLPKTVFAAGDAAVERGSFILESASTIVEDGPALWLEQLGHAIDRVALPRD
ncbi:MAG TPA: FliH/SctL family protein [Sphingomonas sp.]|nr:FliH/SctL family protein [Sphingomonas sp.]